MTESIQGFTAMLREALGHRVMPAGDSFLDLVDDDIAMEFPFAWEGLPKRLDGKDAIAGHLAGLAETITLDRMGTPTVHECADPELVIVEVEGYGRGVASGEAYEQRYICVIRTRNGRIVHYVDYWNPLSFIRTLYGASKVDAILGAGEGH